MRKLLLDLAAMEDNRLAVFSGMRSALTPADREATACDPLGEAELYLKAYASGQIFDVKTDPVKKLAGLKKDGRRPQIRHRPRERLCGVLHRHETAGARKARPRQGGLGNRRGDKTCRLAQHAIG